MDVENPQPDAPVPQGPSGEATPANSSAEAISASAPDQKNASTPADGKLNTSTETLPAAPAVIAAATATSAATPSHHGPVLVNSQPHSVNAGLALLSVGLVALAAILFVKDIHTTYQQRGSEALLPVISREALAVVNDPAHGWFPAPRDPIFGFDDNDGGWTYEAEGPPGLTTVVKAAKAAKNAPVVKSVKQSLQVIDTGDPVRGGALSIPVKFPDPATVYRETMVSVQDPQKLQGIRFVAYDVFIPKDCPGFVGCLLFLKDKDGLWYQARTRAALVPGEWTTVTADIRGDSPDITPLGHMGQWDENQATRVRVIGITFYGDKPFEGRVMLDNFRGWMRAQRFKTMAENALETPAQVASPEALKKISELKQKADAYKEPELRVLNLRTDPPAPPAEDGLQSSPPSVRRFDTLTVRFELNRQTENPFDPDKADITCLVTSPGGVTTEHIGFWYQDYDRNERFTEEELKPIGRPEWRIRITPREIGEYTYKIRVKIANEPMLEVPPRKFVAIPTDEKEKGFIKVSEKDQRFFEFENGEFFYPIGHNLSSPVDIRCWETIFRERPPAGRGLPMYTDFFDKMQKNGENTAEVWMASWWLGVEWTMQWPQYYGKGRYSLQHAWKLDYLLDEARKNGIYIHLVIDNHGKFSQWCDWEWDNNPYNIHEGTGSGIVNSSEDFFSDPRARKLHKNKLRYIAARWGCDPQIIGWELVSEFDLVGGQHVADQRARVRFHASPILKDWARDMIGYLRACDVYDHLVTNHYATDFKWIDPVLVREIVPSVDKNGAQVLNSDGNPKMVPLFDYCVTDAYRSDRNYTGAATRMQMWSNSYIDGQQRKPFWITEYGGDFNAATAPWLDADVFCGMWATWMTEGAGTPLFWWYDFVDRNNLYPYYKGFAAYAKGEDRRGLKGVSTTLSVINGDGVLGSAYKWKTGAYAWVYNDAAVKLMPPASERPKHSHVEASLTDLPAGKYTVEYWSCLDGTIVKTDTVELAGAQPIRLKFPDFVLAMAVKVKKQP